MFKLSTLFAYGNHDGLLRRYFCVYFMVTFPVMHSNVIHELQIFGQLQIY